MDALNSRIVQFMEQTRQSKSAFASKLGISLSMVTHICSGRNKPGIELIQKMMQNYPDINPYWLLLGVGNIMQQTAEKQDDTRVLKQVKHLEVLTAFSGDVFNTIQALQRQLMQQALDLQQMTQELKVGEVNMKRMIEEIENFRKDT